MRNLKRTIKAMLPPLLLDALTGAVGKRYPTWQKACTSAGTYEADLVNRFRADRSALRSSDGTILQGSVLSLLAPGLNRSSLVITDFGGATGDLGLEFLNDYPASSYVVVENSTMVSLMHGKTAIRFTSEMPSECDVFFTSGTLQYLEEPMEILRKGLASARLAAILVRNSFSETETFHVQKSWLFDNGTGPIPVGYRNRLISYPHRTIRESEVMKTAKSMGFRCSSRLEESSGSRGDSYGKQLVLLRS
jgi:putative methyltransferase (TIGR04325 family)